MQRGVWVAVLISWLATGCGGRSDGGAGATRASQCDQILQELCAQAADGCQLFPTDQTNDCVEAGMTTCCAGDCSAAAVSTQQEIDDCIADIDAASCATLEMAAGGVLPATCRRVVRSVPAS